MAILRRFATLCALGCWLGGLSFYTLVVIRAARQVLGSHTRVGFITQKATLGLNAIGAVALALMLANAVASWRSAGPGLRRGLAASWLAAAAAHAWAFVLHARLDAMLDFQTRQVQEGALFHAPHEQYLIATTVEWGAGLVYLLLALIAWKREDAAPNA